MWFETKIDSAPAELPIEGLEAEFPPESVAAVSPATTANTFAAPATPASVASFAPQAVANDPGLAAAIAGGATFSEPMKWLLVTVAGLCTAVITQAVVVSRPLASTEQSSAQVASPELRTEMLLDEPPVVEPLEASSTLSTPGKTVVRRPFSGETPTSSGNPTLRSLSPRVGTAALQQVDVIDAVEQEPTIAEEQVVGEHPVAAITPASSAARQAKDTQATCIPVTRRGLFGRRR